MHEILVIRLYFLLDVLHVSDYIYKRDVQLIKVAPEDGLI